MGKGFAVVAVEVKELADEIKKLVAEVDASVGDVLLAYLICFITS